MGFDGLLVPDWFKPMAGWVVGMDWPEGDESKCFRLADACAATARRVAEGDPASGGRRPGEPPDGPADWDGEALKAFAEHVRLVTGGRQAELVDRLVAAALEFNGAGVQVEYTKRMIEVSVWLLLLQIIWLARAAFVSGGLTLGLIGARAQLTRLTIRQIATRLLFNIGLFGTLVGGMDLGVQASQSRRDAIDWHQVLTSAGTGALTGVFLTGLSGGLSRLSTSGLRAGLARGEMTAAEKWLATATQSMAGMMAQSGVANGAATAVTLGLSGQFDWEMVLKGTSAGVIGAADAHWAGMTPTGRGPDVGGGPGGDAHRADTANDTAKPEGPPGAAGHVPDGARPDPATSLAQAVPDSQAVPDAVHADGVPAARPDVNRIDGLINRPDPSGAVVLPQQVGPAAPHHARADAATPSRPAALRDHGKFAESVATGIVGPREPLRSGTETVKVEAVTLGDGTRAALKELAGPEARDREHLASRLGQAVGADVPATHIVGDRHILIDWVDGERPAVHRGPGGSWEVPGHHNTRDGFLLGLLDTLTSHHDRVGTNHGHEDMRVGAGGVLRGFDHQQAFQGVLPDVRNPLVRNFFQEVAPMRFEWARNPLSPEDVRIIGARIDALAGEFHALGRDDWHANVTFAFSKVAEQAAGTTSLLDAPRGLPVVPFDPPTVHTGTSPSAHPDPVRGSPNTSDVTPVRDAPVPQDLSPGPPDAGGWLGRSADSGVHHSRTVENGATRLEIVTFGDGTSAIRFTGRDADAAEAAALVRQTMGLDGPAIHRSGGSVYQDYGNTALRRSVETGIRDSQRVDLGGGVKLELVTFNDGARSFRREYQEIAEADYHELGALPPQSIADGEGGIHRASETVVYENRVAWTKLEALKPLAWSESLTESMRRSLYDVLTLGEGFHRHVPGADELGRPALKIDRDFADAWEKPLNHIFVERSIFSQGELVDFTLRRNELGEADIAAVSARLEATRPEFERRGLLDWHDDLMDRLGHVARHADGDQPVLGDLDGVPGHAGADGHAVDHHADPPGWPHDLAETEPHEALTHVLQGDNLRELNEAASGRAGDSGDAARAQAYAELADAALTRLPHRDGTVQARVPVDWIPADIAPGGELAFRGFLDGVDDPRFLPDAPRSAQLIIRGDHVLVDGLSGRPHHVMFGADSRYRVLAIHESSYGVKSYFLVHLSEGGEVALPAREGGHPKARPELTGELLRHFEEHREETDAGVWYRDPGDEGDMALADSARAVPAMDGAFYVDGHGNPDGIVIGDTQLTAGEQAMLLLNEPRLGPDDVVIYLGNCRIGWGEAPAALELARQTGRVVIAADSLMAVNEYGDMTPVGSSDDGGFLSERGGLRIFLPDDPIPGGVWDRAKSLLDGGWPDLPAEQGGP
ncbi:hypothetical protein [Streptosporangium sp. NPDC087985]|uniref:WXG100-like domain-containing protein n=1 Tax=Streptosporangium sp. NPDC087985 TaxID=3366196 RepID=UPI00382C084A